MSDNNSNSNDSIELLAKICSNETITPQDLGTPSSNTQATSYLTEGTNLLHYGLGSNFIKKN